MTTSVDSCHVVPSGDRQSVVGLSLPVHTIASQPPGTAQTDFASEKAAEAPASPQPVDRSHVCPSEEAHETARIEPHGVTSSLYSIPTRTIECPSVAPASGYASASESETGQALTIELSVDADQVRPSRDSQVRDPSGPPPKATEEPSKARTPLTPVVPAIVPVRSQANPRAGGREADGVLDGDLVADGMTDARADGLATAGALDAGPAPLEALPAVLALDGLADPPHPSRVTTAATASNRARSGIP